MKKLITIALAIGSLSNLAAQVIISGQSTSNIGSFLSSSVLLQFTNDSNRGLILPWTNGDVSNPENGTIIFNTVSKKVKVFINDSWVDYSNEASTNSAIDTSLQTDPKFPENSNAGVVVGPNIGNSAKGILVLESIDKAMVLPRVASPHLNIVNPSPGMIVFDSVKELLCIYNGTQWSFIQKDK